MSNKKLKIKVCGMKHLANIAEVSQLPIDYMGFIFYPKSARFVGNLAIGHIPATIKKVGVFVNETAERILSEVEKHSLQVVQLHGDETPALCEALQNEQLEVIKAFGIHDEFDWSMIEGYIPCVDFFLFDTKSPQHGGTGQTFDWKKLKEYPFDKPYFLSGGLSLDNIKQAVTYEDKRLAGLDLNSKFETQPALKNIDTLTQALKIIKNE